MEDLLQTAESKGMHLVDNENLCEAENQFEQHLVEPDRLVEVVDPEDIPFASKYKARDLLDKLLNQMEANKTIATMEGKRDVVAILNRRIASVRVRLGSISWECEEPHNAQIDLDLAAEYYFPGFVAKINDLCPNVDSVDEDVPDDIRAPELSQVAVGVAEDAMKCLNMLGILWSGREQIKRSVYYLLAAAHVYDQASTQDDLSVAASQALESLLTHNYFYLAQAYGNIGNMQTSSHYCKLTLLRQWSTGFSSPSAALDWSKNAMGLADFYISLGEYSAASQALQAADFCMQERVKRLVTDIADYCDRIEDFEKSLNRRWIRLDMTIMKIAFERELEHIRVLSMVREGALSQEVAEGFLADSAAHHLPNEKISISFEGIPLQELKLLHPSAVTTFDVAREVYLRCAGRLETAKRQHPMDGFVTDHVTLLQEHSRLYHYLAVFEKDEKRKLAMQQRRIDMLKDVIDTISRSSFEALHKQVSYELGETYATMFDVKFGKLLKRFPKTEDFHDRLLKPADIAKCNDYVAGSIRSFFHFIDLYTSADVFAKKGCEYKNMSLDMMAKMPLLSPASNLLSPEEVKPYLNAHFYCCRMFTKAIPAGEEEGAMRSRFLIAARNRYVWLEKEATRLCKEKEMDIKTIFGEEFKICTEMVALLPSKIDRVSYLRESPILLG